MPRCSCCAYDNEVSPALKERRADVRERKTAGEWQSERKIKKTTTAVNHSLCVCGDGLKFWSDPQTHTWIKRGRQFCSVGAFLHIQSRFLWTCSCLVIVCALCVSAHALRVNVYRGFGLCVSVYVNISGTYKPFMLFVRASVWFCVYLCASPGLCRCLCVRL